LEAGQAARFVVDQRGVDVRLVLLSPGGGELRAMDRPIGRHGEEWVTLLAGQGGTFTVEVQSGDDRPGRYEMRLEGPRPAVPGDAPRAEAEAAYMEGWALEKLATGEEGWLESRLARHAVEAYREALDLWQRCGDTRGQAVALFHLGDLLRELGRGEEALEMLERARPLLEAAGEETALAAALNDLGVLYRQRSRFSDAVAAYGEAARLARRVESRKIERTALGNLATADLILQHTLPALERLVELLDLARESGDEGQQGQLLYKIGQAHLDLGDTEAASEALGEALALVTARGKWAGEARVREALARVELQRGSPAAALPQLEAALDRLAAAAAADPRRRDLDFDRAVILNTRGRALRRLERWAEARAAYGEAARLLRHLGAERDATLAEMNRVWVLDAMGEREEAVAAYRRLLDTFRRQGDPGGEASILYGLARALARGGDPEGAETAVEGALELVETRREALSGSLYAELFGATKQDYFSFYVDLLVERHLREPEAGHAERALAAIDRAHAWGLVTALREARFGIRRGFDPERLARRDELWDRLRALAWRREEQSGARAAETAAETDAEIDAEIRELNTRLELLEKEIRAAHPRYGELTGPPRPPSLEEVHGLLDAGTRLLVYSLGERRSWLFVVGPQELEIHELPGRAILDRIARAAHEALRSRARVTSAGVAEARLEQLADRVLAPAAATLTDPAVRRWVVVPDGALAYVPFAALPEPGAGAGAGEPVVARRETVVLPSLSTLAELRRGAAGRPPPEATAAVFADAVYGPEDPRLSGVAAPKPPDGEAPDGDFPGQGPLDRLPYSAEEAAWLETRLPPGERLAVTGFDATVERLLAAPLERYRILHLAAHAQIDTQVPQLSSVVLSRYDRDGNPLDGRLALHQIYDLELPIDLVVLSACETALGREIRGEGLVGLTRGFMYAGAPRVVVSLWSVRDRATAELMQRFYHALLEQGLPPAAALRQAQNELRQVPDLAAPHQWAGFVLQGDWHPF
jgi:CHAT domain-containing protein/tetratricopeptide (TPR) repeat protein